MDEDVFPVIERWVNEEGWSCKIQTPTNDERFHFALGVGGLNVDVIAPANGTSLILACCVSLSPQHEAAYRRLPQGERESFQRAVMATVMDHPLNLSLNPRKDEKNFHVALNRVLYLENLTRQGFGDAMIVLHHRAAMAIQVAGDYLNDPRMRR